MVRGTLRLSHGDTVRETPEDEPFFSEENENRSEEKNEAEILAE